MINIALPAGRHWEKKINYFDRRAKSLDPIKDASELRLRITCALLILGHLVFYVVWAKLVPQPYESWPIRATCIALGLITVALALKLPIDDFWLQALFSFTLLMGTVFSGAWLYFGNQGTAVWLASLCILIAAYFAVTDWRIALPGSVIAIVSCAVLVPALGVGRWAAWPNAQLMHIDSLIVIAFCVAMMTASRIVDENWQIVRMKAQLKALGVVAHELRTPLAGLQLVGSALTERVEIAAQQKKVDAEDWEAIINLSHQVVKQTEGAHAMITTQLANSNPFKPFSVRNPVDFSEQVKQGVQQFAFGHSVRLENIGLAISAHPRIVGDDSIVRQIVINLLSNALHSVIKRYGYCPENALNVVVREDSNFVFLEITDTGVGIADEERKRIFRPFHTGDKKNGHGLGLTFVQSAVKAYRGFIKVDSVLGVGAKFTVKFPKASFNVTPD